MGVGVTIPGQPGSYGAWHGDCWPCYGVLQAMWGLPCHLPLAPVLQPLGSPCRLSVVPFFHAPVSLTLIGPSWPENSVKPQLRSHLLQEVRPEYPSGTEAPLCSQHLPPPHHPLVIVCLPAGL